MADESQIQELLAALDSNDLQIRLNAIIKLGELKCVEAVPKLIELLNDKDQTDTLRMTVLTALGDIGHISALRAVLNIAREEDAPVSIVAELASTKILNNSVTQDTPPEPEPSATPTQPAVVQPPSKPISPTQETRRELEQTGYADLDEFADSDDEEGEGMPLHLDELLEDAEADAKADWEQSDVQRGGEGGAAPEAPSASELPLPVPAPAITPGAMPVPRPQPISPPRMESGDEQKRRREQASPQQLVQFSAYYPREVKPDVWQPLQAYVFKETAADRVAEDAEKQLGPLDRFRQIVETARQIIREGDTITATPSLPGFQFNPPSATISFFEDWHRFDFKMRSKDAPLNLASNGLLTFTINGIIVADIPLSVFVTHEVTHSQAQPTPPQPIYDTVFASYSHKDTHVVLKVEAAAKTFGITYLRDVITLRSGEDWSAGLEKMIEDATIFQMFWSPPYSLSQHCQREWEYAVTLNKPTPNFIRPVYWLQPMPDPPAPLQHLHFTYQPDLIK